MILFNYFIDVFVGFPAFLLKILFDVCQSNGDLSYDIELLLIDDSLMVISVIILYILLEGIKHRNSYIQTCYCQWWSIEFRILVAANGEMPFNMFIGNLNWP